MPSISKILIGVGCILTGLLGVWGYLALQKDESLGAVLPQTYSGIGWTRPNTDAKWIEDVRAEGLNHRHDFQLEEMRASLSEKVVKHKADFDRLTECPDCFKYDISKQKNDDGTLRYTTQEVNEQYAQQLAQAQEEYERVSRSIERIEAEQRLRKDGKVSRKEDILKAKPSTDREREEYEKLKKQ